MSNNDVEQLSKSWKAVKFSNVYCQNVGLLFISNALSTQNHKSIIKTRPFDMKTTELTLPLYGQLSLSMTSLLLSDPKFIDPLALFDLKAFQNLRGSPDEIAKAKTNIKMCLCACCAGNEVVFFFCPSSHDTTTRTKSKEMRLYYLLVVAVITEHFNMLYAKLKLSNITPRDISLYSVSFACWSISSNFIEQEIRK